MRGKMGVKEKRAWVCSVEERGGIVQRFLGERLNVLPNKRKCAVRKCFGVSLRAQMIEMCEGESGAV